MPIEVARRETAEQLAEERRGRIADLQHALRMLTPSTKDRKEIPVETPGDAHLVFDNDARARGPSAEP